MSTPVTITFHRITDYQMRVWLNADMGRTIEEIVAGLNGKTLQMKNGEIIDPALPEGRCVVAYYETEPLCGTDRNDPRDFAKEGDDPPSRIRWRCPDCGRELTEVDWNYSDVATSGNPVCNCDADMEYVGGGG
jgi:hypothetical protein